METKIIPIVKEKRGDVTDQDNYRPIAITNIFPLFLACLVKIIIMTSKGKYRPINILSKDL